VRWSSLAVVLGLSLALGGCSSGSGVASPSDPAPPSFVIPSPTGSVPPGSAAPSPGSAASGSASPAATAKNASTYTFPVIGRNSYGHTHHDYPATDIITNCGNRVVAATTGTILAVSRRDTWKPSVNAGATRGGLSVSLLGDDGVRYYGSHLSFISTDIKPGAHVTTGQTLGRVGDTGDASACHLHFGISPPCSRTGDWWTQRGTIYPWPYLNAWRDRKNKSAAGEVTAWRAKHGCPSKPLVDP
jgi:murein DD-endopeptidase MepM/ murein hydrolase activator NlpD